MWRRIRYHFLYRPWLYLFQNVMYMILFGFMTGSLFMIQLSDALKDIISKSEDMTVSVYSKVTSPIKGNLSVEEYLNGESEYLSFVRELSKEKGIVYSDISVSLKDMPVKPVEYDADGTFSFYSAYENRDMISDEQLYNWNTDYGVTIKGISNANTESLRKDEIMIRRKDGNSFLTQDEISQSEMVCIVPNSVLADWNHRESDKNDVFTLSAAVKESDGSVAYKEWQLKVVGSYLLTNMDQVITNHDGTCELPVYVPLGTLQRIQEEAVSFLNEKSPGWMDQITSVEALGYVHPVTFEMESTDALERLIKDIKVQDLYENGNIRFHSSMMDNIALFTSMQSVFSAFQLLVIFVVVVTMIFITLNTCISCMKQKYEFTLLMSMGEKQKKIIQQVVIETLFQIIVGVIVALPVVLYGVRKFGVWIFESAFQEEGNFSSALHHAFSLHDFHVTYAQMKQYLTITPQICFVIGAVVILSGIVCYCVSRKMIHQYHPREVLSGDD